MAQVNVFDNHNLNGDHTQTVGDVSRLNGWDDNISWMFILSRTWASSDGQDSRREHEAGAGPR